MRQKVQAEKTLNIKVQFKLQSKYIHVLQRTASNVCIKSNTKT